MRTVVTVTAAKVPTASGAPFVIAALFVLIVLGTMNRNEGSIGLILRIAIAGFGTVRIHRWTNQWFAGNIDKIRSPGWQFVASPDAIEVTGSTITKQDLHRLIVRNGVPEVNASVMMHHDGSMQGAMTSGAHNDRMANRAKAAVVSSGTRIQQGTTAG